MKFTYINLDWNITETDDVVLIPSFLEKIDNTYFEKRENVTKESKKEISDTWAVKEEYDEVEVERAREYCKEQKIRWYWLLKWKKLVDTAITNGFIL